MRRKDRIKELNLDQPDEFVSFWGRVGDVVSRRRNPLVAAVVAVVVFIGAGLFLQGRMDVARAEASAAFAKVSAIASAPLMPESDDTPAFDDGLPHFKTEKERTEAALAALEAFAQAHDGTFPGPVAVARGAYLLTLDRADEAVSAYQAFLGAGPTGRYKVLALDGLAVAQEALGQTDAALATLAKLETAAEAVGGLLMDRSLFSKGRLLEAAGKPVEALGAYSA